MEQNNLNNTNIETPVDNNGSEKPNLYASIIRCTFVSLILCFTFNGINAIFKFLPDWWTKPLTYTLFAVPLVALLVWLEQLGIVKLANVQCDTDDSCYNSSNDDLLTNPMYSSLSGNIYNND